MVSISTSFAASNQSITNLTNTIKSINNLKDTDYTIDSWEDLQVCVGSAKVMVNNPDDYTTRQVNDKNNELIEFKNELVLRSSLDYRGLANYINYYLKIYDKLDESKYTVDSWEYFKETLNDAKLLYTARNAASEDEIYNFYDYLDEDYNNLKLRSDLDYSNLELYIDYTNNLDKNRYDPDSWGDLKDILDDATLIFNSRNADSQDYIDSLTNDLMKAIFALELKDNTDKSMTFLILKIPTITKGKKTSITAILNDTDGPIANAIITITINNKDYTVSTDKKGIAVFKIKGLKSGKHNVKAVYEGNDDYASSTATGTQTVKGIADLKITKIKKLGNSYKITIKNQGSSSSGKFILRLYCDCKKYTKNVYIKSIAKGKSITKVVKFFADKNHKKYAIVNFNKKILESNYKNNKVKL